MTFNHPCAHARMPWPCRDPFHWLCTIMAAGARSRLPTSRADPLARNHGKPWVRNRRRLALGESSRARPRLDARRWRRCSPATPPATIRLPEASIPIASASPGSRLLPPPRLELPQGLQPPASPRTHESRRWSCMSRASSILSTTPAGSRSRIWSLVGHSRRMVWPFQHCSQKASGRCRESTSGIPARRTSAKDLDDLDREFPAPSRKVPLKVR